MNRAFTLLELLVVITIIGILASIVVVSMSGSTDSAEIAQVQPFSHQVHALLGHEAVLDFNFNEGDYNTCSDGKDVCDASGYNNNGDIYLDGADFLSSPVDGYALYFNGSSDYIQGSSNLGISGDAEFTMEAWFYWDDTSCPANYETIVCTTATGVSGKSMIITMGTSCRMTLDFWNSRWRITNPVGLKQWNHVVGTKTSGLISSTSKIYINGILAPGAAEGDMIPNITDAVPVVGRLATIRYFKGFIDEVRIYSQALSSLEIQNRYVQGLEKLLANGAINQAEYERRVSEFSRSLAANPI